MNLKQATKTRKEKREAKFDKTHIRLSGIPGCLRSQYYEIMHNRCPEDERFAPSGDPKVLMDFKGTNYRGDAYEKGEFEPTLEFLAEEIKKTFRKKPEIVTQYDLIFPDEFNLDGSPIVSHPDGVLKPLEKKGKTLLPGRDIECKTTFLKSRNWLPKNDHLKQQLLRLQVQVEHYETVLAGELVYYYAETCYNPDTGLPDVFYLAPNSFDKEELQGYFLINDQTDEFVWFFDRSYLRELENRVHELLRHLRSTIEGDFSLPAREGEKFDSYPCKLKTDLLDMECPWREKCWQEEIEKDKDPGLKLEEAEELVAEYKEVKDKEAEIGKEAKSLEKKRKSIQKKLVDILNFIGEDKVFVERGDEKIIFSYSRVKVPAKMRESYEFDKCTVSTKKIEKDEESKEDGITDLFEDPDL